MDSLIIERIKKEIENFDTTTDRQKVGRVVSVGDGVAEIEGLENAIMTEMVLFDDTDGKDLKDATARSSENALYGLVLNLEEGSVKVVILGDATRVRDGMLVKSTGKVLSVPVSDDILGRVVDTMAQPLDGKGAVEAGMGVSIVSRTTVQKELKLGTLCSLTLDPPLARSFSFIHQKQKFRVRVMDELLTFARQYCQV